MTSQKRITKELGDFTKSPLAGITVALADEADLFQWKVTMEGPAGSPYAGYLFNLSLTLPPNYPFKPPTVTFTTKIYHPNISNDSPPNSGTMCLGMLREAEWKPSTRIAAVLEFARQLLKEPNPEDAVEGKIADQYRNDRAAYEKEAREWVKRYATAKK
ncbi:uncharacterized protein Z519_01373 [Cladophialophora bantiana CBS 173.52]|uniref:E2 ubiquitin-conjugating enzyme n=1 Tax=Cladophialophora bantiana (strain ATCC 10958 / CBS 173.52 / CDC B-1940 / NIH 8579) TaxID=1442370 RepID=A0A0D2ILX2_CLAB1|nr:uncharacterized protein Z519_01373 [Cladophialophora bantiana CBS 173.52]KIW97789.1 hypothetical protein Z519_01373 [Cladophialophora bantiana CBS 173.52]